VWRIAILCVACAGANGESPGTSTVTATAEPSEGPVPLAVALTATGSPTATEVTWTFDDGGTASGESVTHTFLAAGDHVASVSWKTADGTATATAEIAVDPERCPVAGVPELRGEVSEPDLLEISGVVASRQSPGVLWFHEDKNNFRRIYASDGSGTVLAHYDVDVAWDDVEDIAIGVNPETGNPRLYLGDIGDNDYLLTPRSELAVYIVMEPVVALGQAEVSGDLGVATLIRLQYPDGPRNAEALLVDPVTDDIFIVTKEEAGAADVFRKAAPHVDGALATLERVATVDLPDPISGGDISLYGNEILLRTNDEYGRIWLRDGSMTVAEAFDAPGCEVDLAPEPNPESAGFAPDGSGIWTIGEEVPDVWFTPLAH
jgi:PKD repeat protein